MTAKSGQSRDYFLIMKVLAAVFFTKTRVHRQTPRGFTHEMQVEDEVMVVKEKEVACHHVI